MRAVVYKKPFEVAVEEGPGPQAGHPDDVIFRATSTAGQAKDQLSREGTDKGVDAVGDQTQPRRGERDRPRKACAARAFGMSTRDLTSLRQPSQPLVAAVGVRAVRWDKTKKSPQPQRSSNEAPLFGAVRRSQAS
jgi:hypothetical protein